MRRNIKVRLSVKTIGEVPGIKMVIQLAARLRAPDERTTRGLPLAQKLEAISVPTVNFTNMELTRVVSALNAVAEEFDPTGGRPKGVNIVLLDPANANPPVTITLRNLTLKRILDFVTDAVGYQYEVQADAVVIRPGGDRTALTTEAFPVARSTVLRMTGAGRGAAGGVPPATETARGRDRGRPSTRRRHCAGSFSTRA